MNKGIYELANDLIQRHQTRDPFELCDFLGITYFLKDIGSLQGMFTYLNGKPVIFISNNIDRHRQKQVCAHELGHALLHSDIAKERCLQEFEIFNMNDVVEYEANTFSAFLLIDFDEADELFKEGSDIFTVSQILEINVLLLNLGLVEMNRLGYNIKVPDTFSSTRLYQ